MLVDQQSRSFSGYRLERDLKLGPAVASQAVKYITSQTLGMDPHERRNACREVAHFEHDGFLGPSA